MIGYYVHHLGRGHVTRATAIARRLRHPVTGLSTLERPADWPGDWVQLDDDAMPDAPASASPGDSPVDLDVAAHGLLHWVPLGHAGLRSRMAAVSDWIARARPGLLVSDVSVEVALLGRLHGVSVVTVALPGVRDDPAHALGYGVSSAIIAAWPARATGMLLGPDAATLERVRAVGAISRHEPLDRAPRRRHAVVMMGGGGSALTPADVEAMRADAPEWTITALGREFGAWVDDPRSALLDAEVVVTHAGQNSIAEVAACGRPAIVIPQERPHDEQRTTARALAGGGWPVLVLDRFAVDGWRDRLERCAALDGTDWRHWNDGEGATRAAAVLDRIVDGGGAA